MSVGPPDPRIPAPPPTGGAQPASHPMPSRAHPINPAPAPSPAPDWSLGTDSTPSQAADWPGGYERMPLPVNPPKATSQVTGPELTPTPVTGSPPGPEPTPSPAIGQSTGHGFGTSTRLAPPPAPGLATGVEVSSPPSASRSGSRATLRSLVLTGRAGLAAAIGSVVVASASGLLHVPGLLCVGTFEAVLGVGVAMDLAQCGRPQDLEFTRDGDTTARLGTQVRVSMLVRNAGRKQLRGVLRDAWTPSAGNGIGGAATNSARPGHLPTEPRHELDLAPGAAQRIDTMLTPTRRGDRKPDLVTVRSLGPFGLAGRQVSREVPWRLRVLPPFHSRKHLPSRLVQLRETDGRTPVLIRGQGSEFDSLREYVIGDDVRSIDWRATARRNDVVVRTWRPERDRRVVIVLDTSRTSAGRVGDEPKLDSAMDAALLLTAVATRAGDRVELLAYDDDLRTAVTGALPGRTLAVFSDAMAVLEPALVELDGAALARHLLTRVRRRSLIVLLTSLDTASINEGLLPELRQLALKHTVILASVADPRIAELAGARGNANAVFAAASAELALSVRRRTADELGRIGVEVVDAVPVDFAPALADKYLTLKAQGRL